MPSPRGFHSQRYTALCKLLKQMRLDVGMTQAELALKLKTTQGMVAKSESGERRIDPIEFCDWCAATGIDPGENIRKLIP